jgi:hypothetical protein
MRPPVASGPPVFLASTVFNRSFRFLVQSFTQMSFNVNDLLDMYWYATSATTGNRMASAVKIRRIDMYAPAYQPGLVLSGQTVANQPQLGFQWQTNQTNVVGGPSKLYSATALGSNGIATLKLKPPRGSLAAQWISASTTDTDVLFAWSLSTGSVIDFHLSYVMPEGSGFGAGEAPAPVVRAVAGASNGQFYVSGYPIGGPSIYPLQANTV